MRNIIATIAVLLSVCANAQYKETLHATIGPTNTVVTSIPDWAKSDTPPGGGSDGGTSDYNYLTNKPSINGVVLDGNKTAAQLELSVVEGEEDEPTVAKLAQRARYAEGAEHAAHADWADSIGAFGENIPAWYIAEELEKIAEKRDLSDNIAATDYSNNGILYTKEGEPFVTYSFVTDVVGNINVDNSSITNYNDLINKPSINGITLTGNNTAESLRLVTVDDASGYLLYYDSYNNRYVPAGVERTDYANFSDNTEQFGSVYANEMNILYHSTIPDMNQTISRIIAQINNIYATGSVVQVGLNSYVGSTNTIAIGNDSGAQGNLNSIPKTFANDDGETTYATVPNSALGAVAEGFQSLARGAGSVAIGSQSSGYGSFSTSIGGKSYSHGNNSLAVGGNAYARGADTIQIGAGRNETDNTVQFGNYRILNADGTIPPERITSLNNGSETRTADALFRSADNVNTLWTYVYGESVWIAVTNYMRTVAGVAPSFQLWEVRNGKTNCVYWSAEEIDTRVGDKIDIAVSNVANHVATTKADRAWAKYQSMTGADNPQPNDITIVSTPSVMLSGGYEWQRFIDTGNEVWILKCNCPTMLGSSSVSNGVNTGSGYFKITDAEGKTHFSVEKTDSKLVDAVPDSVSFSNDGNQYFQVSFQSNIKPSLYVSTDLNTPFIECKEDSENDYGLTCSWSESDGIYTATIIYNPAEGKPSKLFAYGKVTQEGSVVIKNTAATSFDGGIIIGGNKYTIGTAVIDGKTVLTLENGQAVSE